MIDDPTDAVPSRTGDPDPAEYSNTSKDPKDYVIARSSSPEG